MPEGSRETVSDRRMPVGPAGRRLGTQLFFVSATSAVRFRPWLAVHARSTARAAAIVGVASALHRVCVSCCPLTDSRSGRLSFAASSFHQVGAGFPLAQRSARAAHVPPARAGICPLFHLGVISFDGCSSQASPPGRPVQNSPVAVQSSHRVRFNRPHLSCVPILRENEKNQDDWGGTSAICVHMNRRAQKVEIVPVDRDFPAC